jgi:hypothetical protein
MKRRMRLFAVLRTLWLPGIIYVAAGCATLFGVLRLEDRPMGGQAGR